MLWPAGTSGNPAGRPAGALGKTTLLIQQKLAEAGFDPLAALIEMAKDGATPEIRLKAAVALCRFAYPLPKSQPATIQFDIGENLKITLQSILMGIAEGQIPPDAGRELMAEIIKDRFYFQQPIPQQTLPAGQPLQAPARAT